MKGGRPWYLLKCCDLELSNLPASVVPSVNWGYPERGRRNHTQQKLWEGVCFLVCLIDDSLGDALWGL